MDRFDLGGHSRQISTSSAKAQYWFNYGLNWCFGFNHEEGVKCFQRALEFDPACVMAHWGVAYGAGPFYNMAWCDFTESEAIEATALCHGHIQKARTAAHTAIRVENMLVEALAQRFQRPHPVAQHLFDRWDDDYAAAMRLVHQAYPEDHDIMAIFAEALMTRTPWKLWDVKRGVPPPGANTYEALEVIERSLAIRDASGTPQHPAILHLHIHATEMSNDPGQAMRSADFLQDMQPDAGHMNHMPGHTYVLCGEYLKAKAASEKAIAADRMYLDYAGPFNFYTTARCHDLHLMMYTCMFLGQFNPAMKAADEMCETLSQEVLTHRGTSQTSVTMEGYYSMRMHVLVRFGRWRDIIAALLPACPITWCVSTPMHHYAKAIAHAFEREFDKADHQKALFYEAVGRIPANRKFFNNPARVILGVGEKMMEGEIAYHRGDHEVAFALLREAVQRDDDLEYTEPWAWMHPPRHALAALLAEQDQHAEAEDLYRTDLGLNDKLQRCARHPNNVWALHGLVECLRVRGESAELPDFEARLEKALALTDTPVTSSCLCRMAVG